MDAASTASDIAGTEEGAEVADPGDETLRRIHRERSEVATGQQKTVYTMVTGHNLETGQKLKVKSMIDSGNMLRCGVAITDAFRKKLGLKFYNRKTKTVGTADKSGKMVQIGISEEFKLKIDGIGGYWSGRAGVFQVLSMMLILAQQP